jgi:hypothetical protein
VWGEYIIGGRLGKLVLTYNAPVPTPFYHLSIAEELLEYNGIPEPIRVFIQDRRCDFFLGHIAPDVQVLSDQPRRDTHFFTVPPVEYTPSWENIFAKFPQLADGSSLAPAHAAFIAGYICHLQADTIWVHNIFIPYFGPKVGWGDFRRRVLLHNVLRAFLDKQILVELPEGIGAYLERAVSIDGLPFTDGTYLAKWRDFIAEQLRPGAEVKTMDVFASRGGVSPDAFSEILNSEKRLEEEVLSIVPPKVLVEYRQDLILENVDLLNEYLKFVLN